MDRTGCPRGLYSDHLFEIPAPPDECNLDISTWVTFVAILVVLRIFVALGSWRYWYVSYAKQTPTATIKRKYLFGRRLPIVPILCTICTACSIVAWILATLNVIQMSTATSLLVLAIMATLHLILGSVSFIRFAKIGHKILPLMRRRQLKRFNTPITSKTADEDEDHMRDSRDEEQGASQEKEEKNDSGQNTFSDAPENDRSNVTAVASGIYFSTKRSEVLAAIEESPGEGDSKSVSPSSSPSFISHFSLPVRLLFMAQLLCSLGGCIAAFTLGETDREEYGLVLGCYLMGSSRIIDGLVHFIQAGRAIDLVQTLSTSTTASSPTEISHALLTISRQRNITLGFDLVYSAILFLVAASNQIRGWYLFYALDFTVLCHNGALLLTHRMDLTARRERTKKRVMMLRRQLTGTNLMQWWRDRPRPFWSSANKSTVQNTSSIMASPGEDGAPTYEDAWDQGFRWQRWSIGREKKERKAFISEYKNWLEEIQKQNQAMAGAMTAPSETSAAALSPPGSPVFLAEAQRQVAWSSARSAPTGGSARTLRLPSRMETVYSTL